jgi:Protein kinase domain
LSSPEESPQQRVGKYEILDRIGQGAMGVVYRARDPIMERIVAVKTMSTDLDAAPEMRARFFREARSAGQLSHKNIITIFELGEEARRAYMVMEYVEGEDLKTRIARGERMSLEDKLRLVTEIAEGLAHAHHKKVIHRDIKPANIYITSSGMVKILDFGLAHVASSDITKTGSVLGTPNYMSPEQVRGDKVDHRSDLFATGALFYELLTGRKPFASPTLHATLIKILEEDPAPVGDLDPTLPAELTSIVKRLLAKDPTERYQQADELIKDLDRVRRALDERLTRLQDEAREAVIRLDVFIKEHQDVLRAQRAQQEKADETVPGSSQFPIDYQGILEVRDRARRKYDELRLVAQKHESAAQSLAEATRLEKRGDLEGAAAVAARVLVELPYHSQAGALARRLSEVIARRAREEQVRRETATLLEEARDLHRKGALAESLVRLDRVLALTPENAPAATLHRKAAAALEAQRQAEEEQRRALQAATEKRQKADEALARARQAEADGELRVAMEAARSALAEGAAEAEARPILERAESRLRAQKERENLERRAASLLSEAEKLAVVGDYTAAVSVLRRADESVTGVRPALDRYQESARAQKEARDRVRKIEEHLERGRAALERGQDAACEDEMSRVLALAPEHVEAGAFIATARQRLATQREAARAAAERRDKPQAVAAEETLIVPRPAPVPRSVAVTEAKPQLSPRPTPSPSGRPTARYAVVAVVVVGVALVAAFVAWKALVPAPAAVTSIAVPGPSPGPTATSATPKPTELPVTSAPAIAEDAKALADATRLLEARSFAEAAQAARAVLTRTPGDAAAAALEKRAQAALDTIAEGRRRVRASLANGKPDEAAASLQMVLKLAPNDPEAQKLATELDRYSRKHAEEALARLKEARARAQQARPELAPDTFESARRLESDGQRLFGRKQFSQAATTLGEAADVYGRTETEARAEAERQRVEIERQQRLEAERQKAEAERQRALAAQRPSPSPAVDEAAQRQAEEAKRAQEAARQDRQAISALVQRYKASLEARDIDALKATWPSAPEKELRQNFEFVRSWRVDLQPTEIQITGDTATVACRRRDEMVATDGTKVPPRSSSARFSLRKRAGSWIIEGIQ